MPDSEDEKVLSDVSSFMKNSDKLFKEMIKRTLVIEQDPIQEGDNLFIWLRDNWKEVGHGNKTQTQILDIFFQHMEENRKIYDKDQRGYAYRFYSQFLRHRD